MSRPAALVDPDWLVQAVDCIERLARSQSLVTSEDLRREIEPPENENQIGGAFLAASARKIISPVGYRPSKNKSRRGGAIRVWTLHPRLKEKPCTLKKSEPGSQLQLNLNWTP